VLFMNRPPALADRTDRALEQHLSAPHAYRARYAAWLLQRYAHLVGLDNRWMLFNSLHRFDWWYVIKAKYADGSEEVLPLPLQSRRTLAERLFFDNKEVKLHLNIYAQPDWRRAYGRYLCRSLHGERPAPVVGVVFELRHQDILEREQSLARRTHLEPASHSQVVQVVECAPYRWADAS
jgi:hypothetical protein